MKYIFNILTSPKLVDQILFFGWAVIIQNCLLFFSLIHLGFLSCTDLKEILSALEMFFSSVNIEDVNRKKNL